jgi:hypothetical protein
MWWVSTALAARPVLVWTTAPLPDGQDCSARVTLAADGTVTAAKISKCPASIRPIADAAVRQWRFGAGAADEQVTVWVSGDGRATRKVYPDWGDAGRTCVGRYVLRDDGTWSSLEVTGCATEEATAQWTAALEKWMFEPGRPETHLVVGLQGRPKPLTSVPPVYPPSEVSKHEGERILCQVLIFVEHGIPTAQDAVGCPRVWQDAAMDAITLWRWGSTLAPFAAVVPVAFVQK